MFETLDMALVSADFTKEEDLFTAFLLACFFRRRFRIVDLIESPSSSEYMKSTCLWVVMISTFATFEKDSKCTLQRDESLFKEDKFDFNLEYNVLLF